MFLLGLLSLFCCILAQSTTLGATFNYVARQLPGAAADFPGKMVLLACILMGIGRIVGTALMYRFDPDQLLMWGMGVCTVLVIATLTLGGSVGLVCLVGTSLFVAIGYPTIFATTILDLGARSKIASGMLVTAAGVASAIAPFIMNLSLSVTTIQMVLALTIPCFLVIIAVTAEAGRAKHKGSRPIEQPATISR